MARDRRWLVALYTRLFRPNETWEYVALTADTAPSDLKQRKELRLVHHHHDTDTTSARTMKENGQPLDSLLSSPPTSVVYEPQAPVRAALHGRLLVLDGLEKAERNVLPTLNNLLEHRELSLDDGSLLRLTTDINNRPTTTATTTTRVTSSSSTATSTTTIHSVHPNFRVVALASVDLSSGDDDDDDSNHHHHHESSSSSSSLALDPPLRSRFQACTLPRQCQAGDIWQSVQESRPTTTGSDTGFVGRHESQNEWKEWAQSASMQGLSWQAIQQAAQYAHNASSSPHKNKNQRWNLTVTPQAALLPFTPAMIDTTHVQLLASTQDDNHPTDVANLAVLPDKEDDPSGRSVFVETTTTRTLEAMMATALGSSDHGAVALVGPPGCYKSALVRHYCQSRATRRNSVFFMSLYADLTCRDLWQTRGTRPQDGTTIWRPTPLTQAVLQAARSNDNNSEKDDNVTYIILDGLHKLSTDTLTSLAMCLEQGRVDLPHPPSSHGATAGSIQISPGRLQCIALAQPPDSASQMGWITPEVRGMFHWIRVHPLPQKEFKQVLTSLYPTLTDKDSKSSNSSTEPTESVLLDRILALRQSLDRARSSGAADSKHEQQGLALSLRQIKHICQRLVARQERLPPEDSNTTTLLQGLSHLVETTLLTSLMPDRERKIVHACMTESGIPVSTTTSTRTLGGDRWNQNQSWTRELDPNLVAACRRSTPQDPLLVPNPDFETNPGHLQVLNDMLEAHAVGERALLIMGYQGVGKNRIVDYLLHQLQCEREYLQLHRDTTVPSLLSLQSVERGHVVHGDAPLVRAAKYGRVLVLDEADKAPVEVVAMLKGLLEDGELTLPDGRILRYEADSPIPNGNETENEEQADGTSQVIPIHPDFRVWALANPAGYPFHGNDLAREMADVFACFYVPPLDAESQGRILKHHGPQVPDHIIDSLIDIWQDLREAHEKGALAYPFSVREAVAVVKHYNEFPEDGMEAALDNVIAFDRFDRVVMKQLGTIFSRHGISLSVESPVHTIARKEAFPGLGGPSTPKTQASSPKHGKIDENNDPHVGGNTWAGGSGGSDTAGLGGRGGPYRLDSGHAVHQVSDDEKAKVTEDAKEKARQMAQEALQKKLKELGMDELDWKRYHHLKEHVAVPIQQLQVLLKDIQRRKQERVWLKRQSSGELDDSRLVDALAGERDVFKRRGKRDELSHFANRSSQEEPVVLAIKLVVDVSASMYRFNGYDGRLERLLEACLMIMEALKDDDRFELTIVGHNGDYAEIPLVTPNKKHSNKDYHDPKTQLRILETMIAHTQYTFAGDHTLEALDLAVNQANKGDLVLVISDANLERYRIEPSEVSDILRSRKDVHTHLILIGSLGEEANRLAQNIPNERAQVCLDTANLPLILKNLVASAVQ